MNPYLAIPIAALIALAQSTLGSQVRILGLVPDVMLVVSVTWVLLQGLREGLLVALAGGLVLDALSGAPFGYCTLALLAASLLVSVGESNVFRSVRLLPYAAVLAATLLHGLLFMFLLDLAGRDVLWRPLMVRVLLPSMLVNVLLMPIVYALGSWMRRRFGARSVEWQ